MEIFEYFTEIRPDGYLAVPEDVIKKINLKSHSKLRISILPIETKKKGLICFSGKWQEDRDAKEIVEDLYNSRNKNTRSQSINL